MPKDPYRYFIKRRTVKHLLADFCAKFNVTPESLFGSKPQAEIIKTKKAEIFLINKMPLIAKSDDDLFPTLLFKELLATFPKVIVDMGAVSKICNGADVMAPGVVDIEGEFHEKDLLLIVEERYRKPIAIGQALFDSNTMKKFKQGKIIKNTHHVGDAVWNLIRDLTGKN